MDLYRYLSREEWLSAIECRHSVRKFTEEKLKEEQIARLTEMIGEINREYGLHIQLLTDEPDAFRAGKPSYGAFSGCRNYLAMVGRKGEDEAIGYTGEALVLLARHLGLGSCWVALTFDHGGVKADIEKGEKLYDLIALGFGQTDGAPHRSKAPESLYTAQAPAPDWFLAGVRAASLAPTAINQQKFRFDLVGERSVRAKHFFGPCAKTDLGIVKLHFALAAGEGNFDFV